VAGRGACEDGVGGDLVGAWLVVFDRQRAFCEHAFGQLDDARFFAVLAPGLNSVGVIARHMGANMRSRWTDFLTTDGEKDSRDREAELAPFPEDMSPEELENARDGVMEVWDSGWATLRAMVGGLTPGDLGRTVTIRGASHTVPGAVARAIDHYAFHCGQVNLIARQLVGTDRWSWFTVEPGGTAAFNDSMRRRHGG